MAKENKTQAVTKAKKTARLQKKGDTKKSHKTYTKVRFYKPKTLKLSRTPKYARSVRQTLKNKDGFDKYAILLRPVATEKAMKKMEEENTMVLLNTWLYFRGVPLCIKCFEGPDQRGLPKTVQHQGQEREYAHPSRRQEESLHSFKRGQ
jgi:hypothetical protein